MSRQSKKSLAVIPAIQSSAVVPSAIEPELCSASLSLTTPHLAPERMENEALAQFVADSFIKISTVIPYILELRQRFANLPRGKANIRGCSTWTEFCQQVLHRTDLAVRKAIAAERQPNPLEVPKESDKPTLSIYDLATEMTAHLTVSDSRLSELNALTKRISSDLDRPSKNQIQTLIDALTKISRDAAERAERLTIALANAEREAA